jgi:hypothetical protein
MLAGVVLYACNSNTQEAEAGGSLVQGQLVVHDETPVSKQATNTHTKSCCVPCTRTLAHAHTHTVKNKHNHLYPLDM